MVPVKKCDSYTYLGFVFKPSGSVGAGVQELLSKANRAYYSISNILYQNKKMKVDTAMELFDMTVLPVALYSVEHWGVLSLPTSSFQTKEMLLRAWESFSPETINQKLCRLLLSCHKKSSRLAMLGELGRYPVVLKSLAQTIKYKWSLMSRVNDGSMVSDAVSEMLDNDAWDTWLSRTNKVEKLLNISVNCKKTSDGVGKYTKQKIRSCFDIFWKEEISASKLDKDGVGHNKLRLYSKVKSSFTREPYIDIVQSRNQRSWISRLRSSSSRLGIEIGRYKNIHLASRICKHCSTEKIDDEYHFLMFCPIFELKRACFFGKLSSIIPNFPSLSEEDKFRVILCPTSEISTKVINKYIRIMFNARDNLDNGVTKSCYPTYTPPFDFSPNDNFDQFSDIDEAEASYSSADTSIT